MLFDLMLFKQIETKSWRRCWLAKGKNHEGCPALYFLCVQLTLDDSVKRWGILLEPAFLLEKLMHLLKCFLPIQSMLEDGPLHCHGWYDYLNPCYSNIKTYCNAPYISLSSELCDASWCRTLQLSYDWEFNETCIYHQLLGSV